MDASTSASDEAMKSSRVHFAFPTADTDLTETARLLNNFSELPPQTSLPAPPQATVMLPPPPVVATPIMAKPDNLGTAPASVDDWPKETMRIPCTHCGHYVETMMNEETGEINLGQDEKRCSVCMLMLLLGNLCQPALWPD